MKKQIFSLILILFVNVLFAQNSYFLGYSDYFSLLWYEDSSNTDYILSYDADSIDNAGDLFVTITLNKYTHPYVSPISNECLLYNINGDSAIIIYPGYREIYLLKISELIEGAIWQYNDTHIAEVMGFESVVINYNYSDGTTYYQFNNTLHVQIRKQSDFSIIKDVYYATNVGIVKLVDHIESKIYLLYEYGNNEEEHDPTRGSPSQVLHHNE